jgi:gliding motility-associated transport system permease protein
VSRALLIARRELRAYFRSPLGSVVIASALLLDGILFYWRSLSQRLLSGEALSEYFWWTSGVTITAALFLAMRLVAEERQTGTFTLLNTAPLREWEIIVGKYLSVFAMVLILTLLSVYMPLLLLVNGKVSFGHIVVGYLGQILIGGAAAAIGLFASTLTRSQLVAVVVGAAIVVVMLVFWVLAQAIDPPLNKFLAAAALHHANFRPFQFGILELGATAYYLSVSYLFLFGAVKILEARRWR